MQEVAGSIPASSTNLPSSISADEQAHRSIFND
jgi:hypothetical protein